MKHFYKLIYSPIGNLTVVANEKNLVAVLWEGEVPDPLKYTQLQLSNDNTLLCQVELQLIEYFNHQRKRFDLPLELYGTSFQKKVWQGLLTIPYGTTHSYGQLAAKIGSPKASRAVGGANGNNPISIIVPCHRVIGANGSLTGFGGGLKIKSFLLDLEASA